MGRCFWRQQAAAGGGRHRWRVETRHMKPLVPAGVVCWAHRLALPHADWWCAGGGAWVIRGVDQLRRRVPPRAVAAVDGQELVQGRVHHRERLRVLVGVERQRHGGDVEDLRERVVVEDELRDGRRDRREPRRSMLLLLLMGGGVHAAAGRGRRPTARRWRVYAAEDVVVDEAAGGVLVVVQQVVVVGERRHHRRRRLAGLLVDPAKHPVVQLRKKKFCLSSSCPSLSNAGATET
jgi:hypothetical protein